MIEHGESNERPLERLEEVIRAAFEHDGLTVSGWALVIGTQRIVADAPRGMLPVAHSASWAVGAGTSPATALGLTQGLALLLAKIVEQEVRDEE